MHLCAAFWPQEVVCTQLCKGEEEGQLREEPHPKDSCAMHKGDKGPWPSPEAGGGGERERESTREGPEKDERPAADTGVHCFL